MSSTCREEGIVAEVLPGDRALVSIHRAEACHSCSAQSACVALGGRTREMRLEVANTVGARPGDRVRLALAEADVVTASLLVYMLPAATLVAGALIGYWLAQQGPWSENSAALLGAAGGLILGLGGSRFMSRRVMRGSRYVPRLTAVTQRHGRPESSPGE
ncbi:MAG: hypothetical protein GF355_14745 [Candidatus Eisenbacteria bacterium]|nr:hypothetical protein [Candidatus Eisenbacteria bacterium]